MVRAVVAVTVGCMFVGAFAFTLAQETTEKPKYVPIEQFPLKRLSVKPFNDEFRVSILVGTNNRNPELVAFVFTSSVRSAIGAGSFTVNAPDENGGAVNFVIPMLESGGSACRIEKCSQSFGKWIEKAATIEGKITQLAMKR